MSDSISSGPGPLEHPGLTRDLVAWVLNRSPTYDEVMKAWGTSCPRFPIWEDAVDHGFVRVQRHIEGPGLAVTVTDAGRAFLARGEE